MPKQRWFAMLDDESVACLGPHEDFNSADEELEIRGIGNSVWLFREDSLAALRDRMTVALATKEAT